MNARGREVAMVLFAGMLVISGIGALLLLDRSHGSFGREFGPSQVDASITNFQGTMDVQGFPDDVYMFGSGMTATLSVSITNRDPDNDIDSVRFTIPGSQVQSSSFEWYLPGTDHEWDMTTDEPGVAIFRARDDLPGHIFGGSAQYDVAGNIDDALDHDPLNNTNEQATFSLTFTAPATSGFKTGPDAISVDVADLQTESPGSPWQTIAPFPMPYIVVENGDTFVVMVLKTASCDMAVVRDGTDLFFPTRASEMTSSPAGIKNLGDDGRTFIMVSDPGSGKTVKPVIWAKSSGLQGRFELDMFRMEVVNKVTGEVSITNIATDYQEDIPAEASVRVNTDLDNDGILNNLDTDMDGDGIPNDIDPDPRDPLVNNVAPTDVRATADREVIKEGDSVVLTGSAIDANNDKLNFTWTHDRDASWKKEGKELTVDGLRSGTYVFTLTVSDGKLTATDSVTVKVEKKDEKSVLPVLIGVGIALALIIVIIVIFIARKGGDEGESELPHVEPEPAPEVPSEGQVALPEEGEVEEGTQTPLTPAEDAAQEDDADLSEMEKYQEPCPECGEPLGTDAMKCSSCGAEFDLDLYCPNCDSKIDGNDTACKSCGIKFDLEERPN